MIGNSPAVRSTNFTSESDDAGADFGCATSCAFDDAAARTSSRITDQAVDLAAESGADSAGRRVRYVGRANTTQRAIRRGMT